MFKQVIKWFFEGVIVVVPLGVTIYLFASCIIWIVNTLESGVGFYLSQGLPIEGKWQLVVTSLILLVSMVIFVGAVTQIWFGKRVVMKLDELMAKIPLFKIVYISIRDGVNGFFGGVQELKHPVLVDIKGVLIPGFIVNYELGVLDLNDHVAVYVPMSFSIAGRVLIVSKEQVRLVDMSNTKLMSFVVSGGVSGLD